MKRRTTLWLALLVLFLVSVIYILDHRASSQEAVLASTRIFDITTEPISLMGVMRDGERIEMVRKDDDWFLQAPIRARASNLVMHRLVATAERLRSLDTITAEQRAVRNLSLGDYGLDPAAGFFYLEAGGRREKLSLGSRTPFGSGVYGLRHDADVVVVLPEEALTLIDLGLDELRARALFAGSQRRVNRVDLYRQDLGFLQLLRRGGRWHIQQPMVWPADSSAVQQLLDALYVMQIQRFVWDAPADSVDGLQSPAFRSQVEEANLAPDQARARITVWVEGGDTGEELFLGSEYEGEGQLYARRWGVPSVFTVPELLGEIAALHVNDFRDQRVLHSPWEQLSKLSLQHQDRRLTVGRLEYNRWAIREPVQDEGMVRSDAVEELIRAFMDLRIVSFEPVEDVDASEMLVVRADFPADFPENVAHRELYLVPVHDEEVEAQWLGRIGEDGEFLRMAGFSWGKRIDAIMHPARYRSRRILAVDTNSLNWIRQTSAQGDVSLHRQEGDNGERGAWTITKGGEGGLDRSALELFLATLRRLDAAAVVDFEPESLQPFGLHTPIATITFRFADGERLQQSLLLGMGVESDEVYALLQGHGYIFRLADEDARILKGQLFLPLLEEEAGSEDADPLESDSEDVATEDDWEQEGEADDITLLSLEDID